MQSIFYQLGVICKLAEDALCLIIQFINESINCKGIIIPINHPYEQTAIGTIWTWQSKQFFQAPDSPPTQNIFSPVY